MSVGSGVETMPMVETRMAEGWMTSEGWMSQRRREADQERTQMETGHWIQQHTQWGNTRLGRDQGTVH